MGKASTKVELVARALASRRYGHCGGADACTLVKKTPNWRFCVPDAMIAVSALSKELTPMNMREKIARAMIVPLGHDPNGGWSRTYVGGGYETADEGSLKHLCFVIADAVLDAMREPNEAMIQAAERAVELDALGSPEDDCRTAWRAMIDVAKST